MFTVELVVGGKTLVWLDGRAPLAGFNFKTAEFPSLKMLVVSFFGTVFESSDKIQQVAIEAEKGVLECTINGKREFFRIVDELTACGVTLSNGEIILVDSEQVYYRAVQVVEDGVVGGVGACGGGDYQDHKVVGVADVESDVVGNESKPDNVSYFVPDTVAGEVFERQIDFGRVGGLPLYVQVLLIHAWEVGVLFGKERVFDGLQWEEADYCERDGVGVLMINSGRNDWYAVVWGLDVVSAKKVAGEVLGELCSPVVQGRSSWDES